MRRPRRKTKGSAHERQTSLRDAIAFQRIHKPMTETTYLNIARAAAEMLQHEQLRKHASPVAVAPARSAEGLPLPAASSILASLVDGGCTSATARSLSNLFARSEARIRAACVYHYYRVAAAALAPNINKETSENPGWLRAIQTAFKRRYIDEEQKLRRAILDQVHAAQLRHSSPSPPPTEAAAATTTLAGHFTPAITALLQSAFDARKATAGPLNKGEKRELARATGLTEKQVMTWVRSPSSLTIR